ncbi:hypothetical protein T484DRAFT_1847856 [Baffinella frigidus]|nr:hypothetical protein T484DRAFT_1847856 [Cryptophyta sp. CCMP2293]
MARKMPSHSPMQLAIINDMLSRTLEDGLQAAVGAQRRPEGPAAAKLAQTVYEAALSRREEKKPDETEEQSSAARAVVTLRIAADSLKQLMVVAALLADLAGDWVGVRAAAVLFVSLPSSGGGDHAATIKVVWDHAGNSSELISTKPSIQEDGQTGGAGETARATPAGVKGRVDTLGSSSAELLRSEVSQATHIWKEQDGGAVYTGEIQSGQMHGFGTIVYGEEDTRLRFAGAGAFDDVSM